MAAELRGAMHRCSTSGRGLVDLQWTSTRPRCRAATAGAMQHKAALQTKMGHTCPAWTASGQAQLVLLPTSQQKGTGRQLSGSCTQFSTALRAAAGDADTTATASASPAPAGLAMAAQTGDTYSLAETRALVETAMLAAVSGLAYLLSTLLKLENSLGYFLPLPVIIAACRSGVGSGWRTMMATAFLLLVLLGPLRAVSYVLMHGLLAASLGTLWRLQAPWSLSVPIGAVIRMAGQLAYLLLSSVTMNENLFAVLLANVHALLDQLSAAVGSSGALSVTAVVCMIFALLLVNSLCYNFLLHVIYWLVLSSMGFKLGPLPGPIKKYLMAGAVQPSAPS